MFRNSTFAIVCFALISAAMVTLWAGAMSGGPASYVLLGGCVFGGMAVVYGLDLLDAVVWRARRLGAGVFVRQQADGAILTICQYTPLAIGAYSVFIAGIVTVVAWTAAFAAWRTLPPPGLQWGLVAAAVLPGPVAYAWCRYRRRAGASDLIIDGAMRTVWIPPGPNRKQGVSLSIAEVTDVDVVVWEHEVRTQYGTTMVYTYVPTVVYRAQLGAWKNAHLVEWRDQGKAEALAKWLRREFGVG
jgi:hypothetical protein